MKFRIHDKTWREARFTTLCEAMDWEKTMAIGTLVLFWYSTRVDDLVTTTERNLLEYLPCDPTVKRELFRCLAAGGYITRDRKGMWTIEGNAAYRAYLGRCSEAGRLGQLAVTAKLRRQNALADVTLPESKQASIPGIEAKVQVTNSTIWASYTSAYRLRYGVEPSRTPGVNAVINLFADLVGAEQAPAVLRLYLTRNDDDYTRACHPLSLAMRDAGKLRAMTRKQVARESVVRVPQPARSACRS